MRGVCSQPSGRRGAGGRENYVMIASEVKGQKSRSKVFYTRPILLLSIGPHTVRVVMLGNNKYRATYCRCVVMLGNRKYAATYCMCVVMLGNRKYTATYCMCVVILGNTMYRITYCMCV